MAGVSLDADAVIKRLGGITEALMDRQRLHEIFTIEAQKYIFKNWPTAPGLAPLTLKARQRGGSAVLADTGTLRQSITGKNPGGAISQEPGTLNKATGDYAQVGSRMIYAAIHNFGGTIVPKSAKALAVPMTPEATKAGSPRRFPRPLKFIPSKSAKTIGLLVEYTAKRRGKQPTIKAHYLLMKSVNIPRRKFMPRAEELEPIMIRATQAYISLFMGKE